MFQFCRDAEAEESQEEMSCFPLLTKEASCLNRIMLNVLFRQSQSELLHPPFLFPGFDLRSAQVVSLATGTKCLDSDNVSDHGGTLGDCHAEVVGRRALVRFLYAQMELLLWYEPDAETFSFLDEFFVFIW